MQLAAIVQHNPVEERQLKSETERLKTLHQQIEARKNCQARRPFEQ